MPASCCRSIALISTVCIAHYSTVWGGCSPEITIEFDEKNSYLLSTTLTYNKREAKRKLALNAFELKTKICKELDDAAIFEDEEFSMAEAISSELVLAAHKKVLGGATGGDDDEFDGVTKDV